MNNGRLVNNLLLACLAEPLIEQTKQALKTDKRTYRHLIIYLKDFIFNKNIAVGF